LAIEMTKLDRDGLVALVERDYFANVDAQRLEELLATMRADATFTVATHGVQHSGRDDGIRRMFERLYEEHAAVAHVDFSHVADVERQSIASQFTVRNTEHDGSITVKHNCNFFHVEDGRFDLVVVYMEGENTLQ
jgi:ketosteroid isomerase-like protein